MELGRGVIAGGEGGDVHEAQAILQADRPADSQLVNNEGTGGGTGGSATGKAVETETR